MIELKGVGKQYRVGSETLEVLRNITLHVDAGEFVSIMGPSGSGKSTLMHIIGCLDTPSTGTYTLRGQAVQALSSVALAGLRNREIGFVFQNFHLLARMSAVRNVELPIAYAGVGKRARRDRALELLTEMGLGNRANHLPSELSGGQKQRVAIARALANSPSLLLADEPTGALDSSTGQDIMRLFRDLNARGVTVVVITHDMSVAVVADRIVRLSDGQIIDDKEVREGGVEQ